MEDLYRPPYRCQLEQRAKTAKGWRWLHWDDHAILDSEGNIIEIQGFGRDITEQKEREYELLLQQKRLSLAQKFADAGIWEYSFSDKSLFWSDECKQVFGIKDMNFQPTFEDFLDRIHPDDRELVVTKNAPIVIDGSRIPLDYEHRIIKEDGTVRWVREIAGLVADSKGELRHLVGFLMDITRRRDEEAALERAGMIQQIMENIEAVFFLFSADKKKILYANKRLELIFGKHADVLHKNRTPLFDAIIEEDRVAFFEAYSRFLETGFLDHEMRVRNAENTIRWINFRIFPVENDYNQIVRHVGFARDVSERKEHDNIILEAKLAAENSLRSKSAFLAAINHELRTPISHVLNFSELVMQLAEKSEIAKFAECIYQSGEHLLAMFEDIMSLSGSVGTAVKIRREEFFLKDLIADVDNHFNNILERLGKQDILESRINIQSGLGLEPIYADRGKILQILTNLLNNAVKFTQSGWVSFSISKGDHQNLLLSVEDTGVGIPAREQEHIFGAFHQANRDKNRRFEGLGIGLAISKQVADAMGAVIEFRSSDGEGSIFTLVLPPKVWQS
jgi:PAS domain S-box-containing protein